MEQNGFLRMQAVLGFIEHDRLRPVHDVGGHFLAAMRRQAMHEDGIFGGLLHQRRIDLVGLQQVWRLTASASCMETQASVTTQVAPATATSADVVT